MLTIVYSFLFTFYMSCASRFHGGGFFSASRVIRNLAYSLPYLFFFNTHIFHHQIIGALLSATFAYIGITAGDEDFVLMGTGTSVNNNNFLDKIVALFGFQRDSLAWCWMGMSLKGLIMGLGTLNPLTIIGHVISLPLVYFIGTRNYGNTVTAEILTGFANAIVLLLTINFVSLHFLLANL